MENSWATASSSGPCRGNSECRPVPRHPVDLRGRLGFHDDDRHAVDEERDVGANVGRGAVGERQLIGDVETVGGESRIHQPDVPLPPIDPHEDGLQTLEDSQASRLPSMSGRTRASRSLICSARTCCPSTMPGLKR